MMSIGKISSEIKSAEESGKQKVKKFIKFILAWSVSPIYIPFMLFMLSAYSLLEYLTLEDGCVYPKQLVAKAWGNSFKWYYFG